MATAEGAPLTDIGGTERPQGDGFDMGAYEFVPNVPTVNTTEISSVASTYAISGGYLISDGGASVSA